jgi:hypothetical protein
MVASLLRIIYTGLQDERLLPPKGKPVSTFFQKVFLKAGRFTTAWVRLDFDTRPNFAAPASITLPRQGHLITRLYLVTTMPDIVQTQLVARAAADASGQTFAGPTFGWTNSLGHALIANATLDIGGARVEQLNGRLMEVLDEFNTPLEKTTLMNTILPRLQNGFNPQSIGWTDRPTVAVTPLPFWFSRGDPGTALPIDAINNDQVRITITFSPLNALYVSSAQVDTSQAHDVVPGQAYFPLLNSPFYVLGGPNPKSVAGLTGNPTVSQSVSSIPNTRMASSYTLGDTYLLAEYVYLDKPEANKFRISDIQYPIPQHYIFEPADTNGLSRINIPLRIPNPTRDLFFYAQRYEATNYNAPFLATRDLSGLGVTRAPWWPDASGLNAVNLGSLVPAFSTRESEPLLSVHLVYENKLTRYSSVAPQIFRSLLPAFVQKKSPWINRFYYNLPFGMEHGIFPPSVCSGEANLDKVEKVELRLQLKPNRGSVDPNNVPRFIVYCFAETYNILRIYGGRAGVLFAF